MKSFHTMLEDANWPSKATNKVAFEWLKSTEKKLWGVFAQNIPPKENFHGGFSGAVPTSNHLI